MSRLKHIVRKFWYLFAVLVIILMVVILELTNVTHFFHSEAPPLPTPTGTTANSDKGESSATTGSQLNQSDAATNDSTKATANTAAALIAPSGNFVSAHKVGLNNALASDCTTSSGATCQIIFTKDGVARSLSAQGTDRAGSTYWSSWTPASIGLTSGSWKIQAVATLNDQAKTTDDALVLEVN